MTTRLCFKKIGLILSVYLLWVISGNGQNYVPNVIPPSPNASSLMKFADVPVSPYTGTADITVPIYTIEAKGISLPISLGYHTGGIRLKEEAGWVGLGWALNCGGAISRTIMDKDDFGSGGYFTNTSIPQIAGDMAPHPLAIDQNQNLSPDLYVFFCNYKANLTTGVEDLTSAFSNSAFPWDLEPDIYSFNFAGRAGKFMITRDRKIIMQKQENLKIEFAFANPTTPDYINRFVVSDEQGNKFYFNDLERTQYATGASSTNTISSWALSKIVTQQKDSIMFTYSNDGTSLFTAAEIHHSYTSFCNGTGFSQSNGAGTYYANQVLQTIDFTSGQIQFIFDASRNDLQSGKKLNAIKIFSRNNGALTFLKEQDFYYSYFNAGQVYGTNLEYERLRLDSVKEVSGSLSVPPYVFSYNNPSSNVNYTNKHSYSIDHWGFFNAQSNTALIPTTTIVYDAPGLASTTYTYSGANRAPSTVNDTKVFSLASIKYPTGGKTLLDYENNEYDDDNSITGPQENANVQIGSEQPTIGVSKRGDSLGTIDFTRVYPIIPQGVQGTNLTANITFRDSQNGVHNYKNSFGKIYFHIDGPGFNITEDIGSSNVVCDANSPVCHVSLQLTVQQYANFSWKTHIDPSVGTDFQDVRATFTYNAIQYVKSPVEGSNSTATLAGGLRVKSITDYSDNANNTIAKKRVFEYGYSVPTGGSSTYYTYGRLMSYPSYNRKQLVPAADNNPPGTMTTYHACPQVALFGSSNTALTSVIQGNIVGYDQVNEYTVDPSTGTDNGKTVYTYFNSPDTVLTYNGFRIPGVLNVGNNLNGMLQSKTIYANVAGNYMPVSKAQSFYVTKNRSIYYSPKFQGNTGNNVGGGGPSPSCPAGDLVVPYQVLACFYPTIKSEKVLLDSTVEITYDQSDTTLTKIVSRKNFYDNPKHYELTRARAIDSKGNTHVSMAKYPQDYITSGNWTTNTVLDSLIGKNMVGVPIEKRDSLYLAGSSSGAIAGAQLSTYKLLSSNVAALGNQYALDVSGTITNFTAFGISGNTITKDSRYRSMVSFDSYDNANNIQQYTATDLTHTSFIWDYQGAYPIAKVANAGQADIAYTSFEGNGKGGWTCGAGYFENTAPTGKMAYDLVAGGGISKTGLNSSVTYILSYWSNSGTYNLSSGGNLLNSTPTTGKTINGWTYYEYKLTGISDISIDPSGSLKGTTSIDELRLYPATAQMVTYTFQPLTGMTSQCDAGNRITYYEYDPLGRLQIVRDQDMNIVKKNCYNYLGQSTSCAEGCSQFTCQGPDKKCINGACETGQQVITSNLQVGPNNWKCTYHYQWSDGSISRDYQILGSAPCVSLGL